MDLLVGDFFVVASPNRKAAMVVKVPLQATRGDLCLILQRMTGLDFLGKECGPGDQRRLRWSHERAHSHTRTSLCIEIEVLPRFGIEYELILVPDGLQNPPPRHFDPIPRLNLLRSRQNL